MANQSLRDNTENFLKLAREHLGQHQEKAKGDLQERQKAIETLVNPIREALQKTEQQIAEVEKERRQAYGSIREQLANMSAGQASLQAETRNLVNALRRPEVRGQWGELTLRRLAELAGMVEYCDFYEQETSDGAEGRMRPDMIVRMPNGRELIVDVKTPLDAYLNAMEASDDVTREAALIKHAENVRDRVRELSLKSYWARFEHSPEFVILFIPGDQFLAAALQRLPSLLEEALHQKVILATPTSLVALLKAVAYGWRQVALEENAKKIQAMGEELHRRLGVFSGHLAKLGRQLGSSVDSYNAAVGSLERNVLPGARKFTELGVSSRRDIDVLNPVESVPRRPDLATDDLPERARSRPTLTPNEPFQSGPGARVAEGSAAYYALLFTPSEKRAAVTALFALHRELDEITIRRGEPAVAQVKLQWWDDEIRRLAAGEPRHPITQAMVDQTSVSGSRELLLEMVACTSALGGALQEDALDRAIELECRRSAALIGAMARLLADEDAPTTTSWSPHGASVPVPACPRCCARNPGWPRLGRSWPPKRGMDLIRACWASLHIVARASARSWCMARYIACD